MMTGNSRQGGITRACRNNWPVTNTPPLPPSQLSSVAAGHSIQFSWEHGSDLESPSSSLTYGLRVGRTPGGTEIISPLSSPNGSRRVAAFGEAAQATAFTLTDANPGHYFWSVQAVDTSFAGSPFAEEQDVSLPGAPDVVTLEPTNVASTSATLPASVIANGAAATLFFDWGQTTNLGIASPTFVYSADYATNRIGLVLSNLLSGTSYYFQATATNAWAQLAGPSDGS